MTKDRGEHTAVKLLIVINQFYKGGAETNLLNLLKALPETDDQVDLLVYDQMKLPNVISLLPQVPPHVTVCDAAGREDGNGFWHKALCRITRDATKKQLYRPACFEFVKDKHYDAAISYGEWISPEFVAEHVQADRKIVWIHSDIDKALFFNEEVMFRFDDKIDLYLFASGKSMETALARYPIMQGRATVVHNLCDDEGIRRAAMEKAPETEKMKRPLLLTVANFRAEKNHLRQVEAMALLKKRGLDFTWLNIGSDTDTALISQIDAAVKKRGLEGRFIRMPAQASPYRFMKNADAVCVLSDFESWSLVISEAKLVGTPVIATRTSGAIEQIEDGETGVLCDFTPEAIADGIERLLSPLRHLHVPVHDFAMMMTIALRFIPTLIEETDKIMSAQKARGADFDTGNLIQKARALIPLLVPLFISAFRRADELAVAMECRCYHGGEGRTRLRQLVMGRADIVALTGGLAIAVAVGILGRMGF